MTAYVDYLKTYPSGRWCHLLADSEEELHKFAELIQKKRSTFQVSNNGTPHYDLTPRQRKKAIENGAKIINKEKLKEIMGNYSGSYGSYV